MHQQQTFVIVLITVFILFLILCFWHLIFFLFLSSSKTWLSERFPYVSKYELFLLEHFLFYFKSFYICTRLPTFILIIIIIIMIIFVIIVFILFIAIIVSSFSMLLSFICLVFIVLFCLCVYQIFLSFKHMTWPNIVQSWQ